MQTLWQALAYKVPVVFTRDNHVPLVVCETGKEAEALDLMVKMGLIERLNPSMTLVDAKKPETVPEKKLTDAELLDKNGWDLECHSPLEIRHRETGSFATFWAADIVIDHLREENGGMV